MFFNDEVNEKCVNFNKYEFPGTRYQGSKLKIVDWIWENIKDIEFESALDLFGGTGSVAYMLKKHGKKVIYNDILKFNSIIGKALIENNSEIITDEEVEYILTKHSCDYPSFIQDNFSNIFYLDEENQWLDYVAYNIRHLDNEYKKSMAYFALFQACIIKRPYNLFHRANLYVRTSNVKRGFGNKSTWDKPFEKHFRAFINQANQAIFNNNHECLSLNYDAVNFPAEEYNTDLVYIDPPYINAKGVGTDYLDFYHFLEGMVSYDEWNELILPKYKHKSIKGKGESPWINKKQILEEFDKIFSKFKNCTLVISYRDNGIPTHQEIMDLLGMYKSQIIDVGKEYKYALANEKTNEMLIIAK
ncbi:DNA methyltransferase [Clostridium botulinum]|nr:DNA methyltransferase [Clostridium botulinum]NFA19050.1 DNA methyltransferase [Clostridium botulinum]NFA57833.1 DNA methyltransferase [Clostridium botulinum]NFA70305.1 DNA methyltransferase [Clostridium botulinum]NFA78155.1 DNA methyltransferase [Clostridium botulinum]